MLSVLSMMCVCARVNRWFDLIRSRPVRLMSTAPSLVPYVPRGAITAAMALSTEEGRAIDLRPPHQEKVATARRPRESPH